MAFRHGRFGEITVNGTPLSIYCDTADVDVKVDTDDTTTFTALWKTAIAGLIGAEVTLGGNYDPTLVTGPQAVLVALLGAAAFPVIFYPGGNTAGQRSESFSALLINYKESGKTTAKVTFAATLLVTGAITYAAL